MISRAFRPSPSHLRACITERPPAHHPGRSQGITRQPGRAQERRTQIRKTSFSEPLLRKGPFEASYSSVFVYIVFACGSAVLIQQYLRGGAKAQTINDNETFTSSSLPSESPFYTDMPVQPGQPWQSHAGTRDQASRIVGGGSKDIRS